MICNMTKFCKKVECLSFDPTPKVGGGVMGRGLRAEIFATVLLHFMTIFCIRDSI